MSSSTSSSSYSNWIYDVFLSYTYDVETWDNFVGHLYDALVNAGINVYKGDHDLPRGEDITSEAIQGSRISLIVFSRKYAASKWCIEQLVKIIECRMTGSLVLPVFYEVEPSEVGEQTGNFGKAFEELIERFPLDKSKVVSWSRALTEAASVPGFHRKGRSESDSVMEIVKDISRRLEESTHLFVAKYPVGIRSQVQDVIQMLDIKLDDIRMAGITGAAGIGKTTIAKAVFNEIIHNFEAGCFLANIRESWDRDNGGVRLQEHFLFETCETRIADISCVEEGSSIIKGRLSSKRVLVVLDDVDRMEQLQALSGSRDWFRSGSRIIITTRYTNLLSIDEAEKVYEVPLLNKVESLELFSWYAFKENHPREDFIRLSRRFIYHCIGLPLVLKVLGSSLFDRRIVEWESTLENLQRVPDLDIFYLLRISFDSLSDDAVKYIFLNICCSFIGMERNYVQETLEKKGYFSAEIGISVLMERELVAVDNNNKLTMHELLKEMGMEISREKSTKRQKWINDVFLSFRGIDTRNSLTGHLYSALANAGINTFIDDGDLPRGEDIELRLLEAIEGSRVSVIVFSTHYAASSWCLDELVKIIECRRTANQVVLPIFYKVEPSDVRKQTGSFAEAIEKQEKRFPSKVSSWRRALTEAGNLSGRHLADGHEGNFIDKIVIDISRMLDKTYLFIAQHPVGIESRVHDMIPLIGIAPVGVRIIGILGMSGVGKTTIAKAIYNEVRINFKGGSFLANIREVWGQDNGQIRLQEQLLTDVFMANKAEIRNVDGGIILLKERLCNRKVLVVLDDVDKWDQLKALCGNRDWFHPGSRIIITTKDEHLLKLLEVDAIYWAREMDETEALEFFSWHAFKERSPKQDFIDLSSKLVKYCGRLPLALEVLGSYLFDRKISEWENTLDKLKIIPDKDVQEKLKISFDDLSDDKMQDIFLDISFFFIGMNRNDVVQILDSCGLFAETGICVLMERCLVSVDKNNKLTMHDLLRDMGREIVRKKWPEEPEERSRLWLPEDVVDVLTKQMGTKAVKGLTLKFHRFNKLSFNTKAFKKMQRLRLLQFHHVQLSGEYNYLSKDLRWLCWHGFPLQSIPDNFYQRSLVAVDLRHSKLKLIWKDAMFLEKLKILNLSHSHYLTQTPDFSQLPNLEKLILKDCSSLSIVHESIGCLNSLLFLNFKDCQCLNNLPRSFYKLKSLKTLNISGCSKIDHLEEDVEQMVSLTTLIAGNTAIKQIPFSIVKLKSIGYLSICGHQGSSLDVFPSVIWSWMSPRNDQQFHICSSRSLTYQVSWYLRNNYSCNLQSALNGLFKLQASHIGCGSKVQQIQDFARNLTGLYSTNWTTFKRMSNVSSTSSMENLAFNNFQSVADITFSGITLNTLIIYMGGCNRVTNTPGDGILQGWTAYGLSSFFFPDADVSEWFIYKEEGPSVFFEVPHVIGGRLTGFTVGIVYSSCLDSMSSDFLTMVIIINHTKGTIQISKRVTQGLVTSHDNQLWQGILSNIEGGDEVEVIVFQPQFDVKKIAVYLAYSKPINSKMIECPPSVRSCCYDGEAGPSNSLLDPQLGNQDSFVAPTPSIEMVELTEDEENLLDIQSHNKK
ncbi:Disease resistance protein (TIR-NBS-LRR class) [Quillaja saponaria]|uniref:Disease resistance protein (TIR-NBS-LRR class) n=1 Tax=Quillaja saponaria TaxID=32244 RepID=A0AAD7PP60_QUISA|nr:Disease resistance protein (TIR-NBS-LRR class) [Quillaja saponaria]